MRRIRRAAILNGTSTQSITGRHDEREVPRKDPVQADADADQRHGGTSLRIIDVARRGEGVVTYRSWSSSPPVSEHAFAMGRQVTGLDGNYRITCHTVMEVLREHRDSVMAVLEAFVYDPLLNWRLMDSKRRAAVAAAAAGSCEGTAGARRF